MRHHVCIGGGMGAAGVFEVLKHRRLPCQQNTRMGQKACVWGVCFCFDSFWRFMGAHSRPKYRCFCELAAWQNAGFACTL